jgi:hypothetical protein
MWAAVLWWTGGDRAQEGWRTDEGLTSVVRDRALILFFWKTRKLSTTSTSTGEAWWTNKELILVCSDGGARWLRRDQRISEDESLADNFACGSWEGFSTIEQPLIFNKFQPHARDRSIRAVKNSRQSRVRRIIKYLSRISVPFTDNFEMLMQSSKSYLSTQKHLYCLPPPMTSKVRRRQGRPHHFWSEGSRWT